MPDRATAARLPPWTEWLTPDARSAMLAEHSADPGAVACRARPAGEHEVRRRDSPPTPALAAARSSASSPPAAAGRGWSRPTRPPSTCWPTWTAPAPSGPAVAAADDGDELVRAKRLAQLRITARDLLGLADLETTTADLADLATAVLAASVRLAEGGRPGRDRHGQARRARAQLRQRRRPDVRRRRRPRRPGGDGPRPALLPGRRQPAARGTRRGPHPDGRGLPGVLGAVGAAVGVPGPAQGGARGGGSRGRPGLGRGRGGVAVGPPVDRRRPALAARPAASARSGELRRQGAPERDVKRGPGGIRDIEFAVQTLQLVHGAADAELRSPTTLAALAEMARGGYVAVDDAEGLSERLPVPAPGRARAADRGRPADPHRARRPGPAPSPGPGARLPGSPRDRADRGLRPRPRPPAQPRPRGPRAPVLPPAARLVGGGGAAVARGGGGRPGQLRLRRRGTDPGRGPRADTRA